VHRRKPALDQYLTQFVGNKRTQTFDTFKKTKTTKALGKPSAFLVTFLYITFEDMERYRSHTPISQCTAQEGPLCEDAQARQKFSRDRNLAPLNEDLEKIFNKA